MNQPVTKRLRSNIKGTRRDRGGCLIFPKSPRALHCAISPSVLRALSALLKELKIYRRHHAH